ncbi:hypothetical protein QYE76_039978 [Lolium multiflorum]|uniref:DUF4216 domain-containing protein n=1 Tax=Lolium multiflorum TaxID=4521 RepID=A0AAD8TAE5_LOLMU|nr:hypothetical protein QYE76_039978 [Lolium multiflorum]
MNVTDDEQLYLLAKQPSSTISTFQGYEINGNTFYTFAQDKKSTNQNSGVRFDAEDGNGNKVTYYGYIEEIWELDYGPNFKVPLFQCKWFNLKDGVQVDPQYGMTTVDFKNLGRRAARLLRTSTRPAVGCGGAAGLSRASWPTVAAALPSVPAHACSPADVRVPRPDASDDDDGDYDDYSGDYYRARHERATKNFPNFTNPPLDAAVPPFARRTAVRTHAAPPSEPRRAAIRATPRRPQPRGRRRRAPQVVAPSPAFFPPRSHARSHCPASAPPTSPHHAPRAHVASPRPAVPARRRHADDAKPHSAASSTPPLGCSTKCRRRPCPCRCCALPVPCSLASPPSPRLPHLASLAAACFAGRSPRARDRRGELAAGLPSRTPAACSTKCRAAVRRVGAGQQQQPRVLHARRLATPSPESRREAAGTGAATSGGCENGRRRVGDVVSAPAATLGPWSTRVVRCVEQRRAGEAPPPLRASMGVNRCRRRGRFSG